jgi:hypothetical protein
MSIFSQSKWDGTYIGKIDDSVMEINLAKPMNYFYLRYNSINQWVSYHKSDSELPCIIDELAPIFGIPKIGTHSAEFQGRLVIIYNTPIVYNDVTKYKKSEMTFEFRRQIQDVISFRLFMGLGMNWPSSIIVRDNIPCSYNNKIKTKGEPLVTKISRSVTLSWFVDDIIDSKIRMGITEEEDNIALQEQITTVIYRINRQLIWFENYIIDSINRLI